ncbi:MAG: hypothetical protein LC799_27340, partial [Actinobacteria bacterium]|nr:hypothetical protein [Actinomycetota bacterium]
MRADDHFDRSIPKRSKTVPLIHLAAYRGGGRDGRRRESRDPARAPRRQAAPTLRDLSGGGAAFPDAPASEAQLPMNETTAILSRLWEIKNIITREGAGSPRWLPGGYDLVAESATLRTRLAALRAAGTSPRLARTQPRPGPIGPGSPHRSVTLTRAPELDIDPIGDPRWCAAQVARLSARARPWDLSKLRAGQPLALGAELRSRALTAVERAPGASDPVRQAGTRIVEQLNDPYGRLARGILALSDPSYMAAW